MAKWKAPADAGPGVSIGGQFFPVVDGHVETPDGEYSQALEPFGYVAVDDEGNEGDSPVVTSPPAPLPQAAVAEDAAPVAPEPAPEPDPAPAAPVEPEAVPEPPVAAPEPAPVEPAPEPAPAADAAPASEG
jgi:outer membrane biosynthesis protein TonB